MAELLTRRVAPYTEGTVILGDAFQQVGPMFERLALALATNISENSEEMPKLYFPYSPTHDVEVTAEKLKEIAETDSEVQYIVFSIEAKHSADVEDIINVVFAREDTGDDTPAYVYKNVTLIPCYLGQYPTLPRCLDTLNCIRTGMHVYTPEDMVVRDRGRLKKRLEAMVTEGLVLEKSQLETDIATLEGEQRTYSDRLMCVVRELAGKRRRLEFNEFALKDKDIQRMLKEVEELTSYSTLKSVDIVGSNIIFVTRELALNEPNNCKRPLGRYTVKLNMVTCEVNFTNNYNRINTSTWGRSNKIAHPHCNEAGNPCLGNLGSILPELVATKDLLAIWQVLLSFLTSYNPQDSWGKRAKYWDKYDADGNLMKDSSKCKSCGCDLPDDPFEDDPDHEDGPQWYECPSCGGVVCADCARELEGNEEDHYCPQCASSHYCYICDAYHSFDTDMVRCADCGNTICDEEALYNSRYDKYFCGDGCEDIWLRQRWEDYPEEHPDYVAQEDDVVDLDPDEEDPFPPMDEEVRDEVQTA